MTFFFSVRQTDMIFQRFVTFFLPFFYPVRQTHEFQEKPILITLGHSENRPLVGYRSPITGKYIIHSDTCPHMGAQLHHGWIADHGGLHCPYHGFEFNEDGMFCSIPNPIKTYKRHDSRIFLDKSPNLVKHDYVFIPPPVFHTNRLFRPDLNDVHILDHGGTDLMYETMNRNLTPPFTPFFPPEQYNDSFRVISGSRELNQYQDVVTENLLDMLHISYIHSFGSRLTPLPLHIKEEKIHDWGYKTRFVYSPHPRTISRGIGGVTNVIVENEIYMPSTTITRVYAGDLVKTVHTMTTPRQGKKSTLYWRIYRNFWRDPYFDVFDSLGDVLLNYFMEKTIDEDVWILDRVYPKYRDGHLITKYDVTIQKYRSMIKHFSSQT